MKILDKMKMNIAFVVDKAFGLLFELYFWPHLLPYYCREKMKKFSLNSTLVLLGTFRAIAFTRM